MKENKELFRALVGSHNYNLQTETSDKDYKVFINPTFDNLYYNQKISKSLIGDTEDLDYHDIRKITDLFWKSNVNFLELLFSEEVRINDELNKKTKKLLNCVFDSKDYIAQMNLPYLYNACIGMHKEKRKNIHKGTKSTQILVDEFGYDTKQAMHSIRILDVLRRFADSNFNDFKYAIRYDKHDPFRNMLLDIKNGQFSEKQYYIIADHMLNMVEKTYKQSYLNREPDVDMKAQIDFFVKVIVRIELDIKK